MFSSPRRRRRLLTVGVPIGLLATAVVASIIWPNTGDDRYRRAVPVGAGSTAPPPLPEYLPLGGTRREAALATAREFIRTAVARDHVRRSWPLAHPLLRQGYTEREWATGEIPVVPYPVEVARWRLGESTVEGVAFEVLLLPKAGAEVRPQVFDIELKEVGQGATRRWAVSSWAPRAGGINQAAPGSPERVAAAQRELQRRYEHTLGAAWLIAPAVLLGGVLLAIPVFLVGRDWRRRRRGERLYRDHLARRAAD